MTSSYNPKSGLSQRLNLIRSCYRESHYIWDIGCDHGKIGLSFIDHKEIQKIHLVDPSKNVLQKLTQFIKDSDIPQEKLSIIHKKGEELEINQSSNFIFIAGMGGELIIKILNHLLSQLDESSFIAISPHTKILEVREFLHQTPLSLENEFLVHEHGKFYQVLCLRPFASGDRVSLFGQAIWKGDLGESFRKNQIRVYAPKRDHKSRQYCEFLRG